MAGFALSMESILERKQTITGFLFVAGPAGLPFSAPVIQECIKIMMAPSAIELFRMELVIELDQGSLALSNLCMIKHKGVILGMSHRYKSRKDQDTRQKFYVRQGSDNNLCAGRLYLFGFIFPVLLSNKSKPHPERNS